MAVQPYSATAPIKALAGTEASPGITFTGGDTNTGIYSPAANQLGITTGGTGKLIIDENGSLQVVGGTKDNPAIYFDEGTGIYSPGADQLAISTNGTQALYINSDGDILVADGNRMEIDEIRARDDAGLKLFDDGGTGIFINDGGNVGIGTVSPNALFHLEGNSDDTSAGGTALLRVESLGAGTDAGIRFKSAGSTYSQIGGIGGELYAYTDGNERLRITTDGRLGVGTSTPGDRLELAGAGNGIILASPDGTRYRLTVANGGTLSIAAV